MKTSKEENMSDDKNQTDIINNYSEVSSVIDPVIIPQKLGKKRPGDVNSYEELVSAIEAGLDSIKNGRVVNEEIMMKKIKRYAGIDDI